MSKESESEVQLVTCIGYVVVIETKTSQILFKLGHVLQQQWEYTIATVVAADVQGAHICIRFQTSDDSERLLTAQLTVEQPNREQ